jgi:signal peptidase I
MPADPPAPRPGSDTGPDDERFGAVERGEALFGQGHAVPGGPEGVASNGSDRPAGADAPMADPATERWVEWPETPGTASTPAPRGPGASDPNDTRSGSGRGAGSFLRELPVLLLVAFVLAFLLRTFVVQVFYIPSSSMEATLQINDRMVVEKVTYRFREPRRGEIVVFEGESFGSVDPAASTGARIIRGVGQFLGVVPASARDFVKRVIGLPGDEIRIEEGRVYVNDVLLDEPYVVYDDPSDFGPVTVPDDSLFFLGDNRPNSSDSRRSLGFVPRDNVVGRAAVIIWPLDHAGLLTDVEHQVPAPDGTPESLASPSGPRVLVPAG